MKLEKNIEQLYEKLQLISTEKSDITIENQVSYLE